MYILCVYGPSACNKTDDDDDKDYHLGHYSQRLISRPSVC